MSNKSEYGTLLTKLIKDRNITQSDFYSKLGIKKPYFYDIISGKANPPPIEMQIKILKILKPNYEIQYQLLDIAAKSRNELPADIIQYISNNRCILAEIRNKEDYKEYFGGIINGEEKN